MSGRRAGDCIGYISRSIQTQFLNYSIRRAAAWRQIEALGKEEIKMFGELNREFDLNEWVYHLDTASGKIILERQRTMQEQELGEAERALLENSEGEVAK